MEIGKIFSTDISGKPMEFKLVFNNSYMIIIELITKKIFYPEKIIFEIFKNPLRNIIEPTHGVFIKDNFSVSSEVIKKPNRFFALTTSGTVQFTSRKAPKENSYSGSFITPTQILMNDDEVQNYFIIFK